MAEILSSKLFGQFLWSGGAPKPTNTDWACIRKDHEKSTHPSDVVFWYDQPYSAKRAYINCDLKSYAKGTISATNIASALTSMAHSVACANSSSEWRELYVAPGFDADVIGLLFIYNHDGEYDKDFESELRLAAKKAKPYLPSKQRMFVIGPADIFFLNNIVMDIRNLKADGKIPLDNAGIRFYFPNLVRRKLSRIASHRAATIEMLASPWISMEYAMTNGSREMLIYYKGKGTETDEFMYLLDYLLFYQVTENYGSVSIRYLGDNSRAKAVFSNSVEGYIGQHGELVQGAEALEMLKFETVPNVVPVFSKIEIGMRDA